MCNVDVCVARRNRRPVRYNSRNDIFVSFFPSTASIDTSVVRTTCRVFVFLTIIARPAPSLAAHCHRPMTGYSAGNMYPLCRISLASSWRRCRLLMENVKKGQVETRVWRLYHISLVDADSSAVILPSQKGSRVTHVMRLV